eukprot:SAG31_NODE_12214_length_958_cov_1.201397_2_plen_43_part_01
MNALHYLGVSNCTRISSRSVEIIRHHRTKFHWNATTSYICMRA